MGHKTFRGVQELEKEIAYLKSQGKMVDEICSMCNISESTFFALENSTKPNITFIKKPEKMEVQPEKKAKKGERKLDNWQKAASKKSNIF